MLFTEMTPDVRAFDGKTAIFIVLLIFVARFWIYKSKNDDRSYIFVSLYKHMTGHSEDV